MDFIVTKQNSSIDESLLNEIFDFIYPNDRYLFKISCFNVVKPLSIDEFKIDIVNNEFNLAAGNSDYFYNRIEKLSLLNSSLDKYLTGSNNQRYSKLIDSSFHFELLKNLSKSVNKTLPNVRKWFDEYKFTTLYNYSKILSGYNRLNRLSDCVLFLQTYKEMNCIREFVKMIDVPVIYRIVACSYGLELASEKAKEDSRLADTLFFNVLRDNFSITIDKLMTNVFVKNQYRYDWCDKLVMLMVFGKTNDESSDYIISLLSHELVSVASLTLQKYWLLENEGVTSKCARLNGRDVSVQASLLSPDLSLLVVCKVLSEFIEFFQNLFSSLKNESKFRGAKDSKRFNTGIIRLDVLLRNLKEADYQSYYGKCLSLFVCKFGLLVDTSFDILYKLVSNFNFNSIKDQNDILKIALLILYYTTLQKTFNDTEKECKNDLNDRFVPLDKEFIGILNERCNKNLCFIKTLGNSSTKTRFKNLEDAVSSLLTNYSKRFASECLQNIVISLSNEKFHRVAVNSVAFENFQIDLFCTIFKNYISSGKLLQFQQFKFPALNPFLGWTPDSNFVTINVVDSLLAGIGSNNGLINGENGSRLDESIIARLSRDYGGVYTLTSRMVLRDFEHFFKIILVHPTSCVDIMRSYTKILDTYMHKIILSCKIDDLVIQNLNRFNKVLGSRNMGTYDSISTSDTDRSERTEITKLSDHVRMSYVVNAVESCFALLESLGSVVKRNKSKNLEFYKYLKQYYLERNDVIVELRLVLYHVVIYNVLRPMMPSVELMKAVIESKPIHIQKEVEKPFENFKKHLEYVDGFMDSADHTGFPIMVKLLLWDSIINVIKDSFKPLLNLFSNNSSSELGKSIYTNYAETLQISNEIRAKYVNQVQLDHERHRSEIANISTYYKLVEELVESLK